MPVDGSTYPVHLLLAGRPVLVVGGGRVATQKVQGLLAADAAVTVVAPRVGDDLEALAAAGALALERRHYRPGEVAGYRYAVTATGIPDVDGAVFADAEVAGVWVNAADDPAHCSVILPAVARRGPITLTASTGGRSPALATWLRRRFEVELDEAYVDLLDLLATERERLRAAGRATEGLNWQGALDSGMLELVRSGHLAAARERLQACLSSSSG